MLLKTNRFFTILIIILSGLSSVSIYGCCFPFGITGDQVSRATRVNMTPIVLWLLMEEQGADEIFKSWRDTELIDEKENPRRALGYWDSWLSLPVK